MTALYRRQVTKSLRDDDDDANNDNHHDCAIAGPSDVRENQSWYDSESEAEKEEEEDTPAKRSEWLDRLFRADLGKYFLNSLCK